jgi:hypothetical protein
VDEPRVTPAAMVQAAAAASGVAALVHASVITVHFGEYWLFGLFFLLVTPLQLVWGVVAWNRPDAERLLRAGAIGNGLIVLVWLVSRLVGLPFGPNVWEPEAIGIKDLIATYDEIAVVVLVALVLRGRTSPMWFLALTWVLVALGGLAVFVGGH